MCGSLGAQRLVVGLRLRHLRGVGPWGVGHRRDMRHGDLGRWGAGAVKLGAHGRGDLYSGQLTSHSTGFFQPRIGSPPLPAHRNRENTTLLGFQPPYGDCILTIVVYPQPNNQNYYRGKCI